MRIAAVDIGGTHIKACLFAGGMPGHVLEADTNALRGGPAVLQSAADMIAGFLPFDAVGVSTGGQVDDASGVIIFANENIPGYSGMDVRGFFAAHYRVPVAVENDVNAAAIGEGIYGAAKGQQHYLCLTYGTGVGGAIVLNGRLYRGNSGSAGEFGGIVVHPEHVRPGELLSGCYENSASARALVRMAQAYDPALKSGRAIFSRMDEANVRSIVDEWIDEIVHGVVSLTHIFNPACIVLGGGVLVQPYVAEQAAKRANARLMDSFRTVRIVPAQLGNMAGLYGAAHLAEQLFKKD